MAGAATSLRRCAVAAGCASTAEERASERPTDRSIDRILLTVRMPVGVELLLADGENAIGPHLLLANLRARIAVAKAAVGFV